MTQMRRLSLLLAAGAWLFLAQPAAAQTLNSFTMSYSGGSTNSCGTNYSITGYEPASPGAYPVFIYLVGTTESYTDVTAMAAIQEMAERGYVAATVNYPNGSFGGCDTLSKRSRCVFNSGSSSSAVSRLCSRANADCSKGVVAAGFSQGSILSILSRNYNSNIRAVYGLGAGVQYSFYDLRACVADGKRSLPSTLLRAVTGEEDGFMGGNATSVRGQLNELTGMNCTGYACERSNGSGWIMPRNSDVVDGTAEHCYMRHGGCNGTDLDNNWRNTNASFALEPNLNWLTGFTSK